MNPRIIDPRFKDFYERELKHLREMGVEFARDFPKIAGRLKLGSDECADPYVERLLEGFSFLTARVQMKIDDEFPRFTQHLAELVYPNFLAPTPSMMVVQLNPNLTSTALGVGFEVPRGSSLQAIQDKGVSTACQYRTAHNMTLWPLELVEAKFFTHSGSLALQDATVKAGLRLRLRATGEFRICDLPLDSLTLHLCGSGDMPHRIYERLLAGFKGVLAGSVAEPGREAPSPRKLPKARLNALGFSEQEALLPSGTRTFQGYRLLQEYFAFPQRFLFVELSGLAEAVRRCEGKELDVTVLLNRGDSELEQKLSKSNFLLHCTPAINLFERRGDRLSVDGRQFEFHVLPDRVRPLDFEVFQVLNVTGYGAGFTQQFEPFYRAKDLRADAPEQAFYQIRREKRVASERLRKHGPRSSYPGSEIFLTLVDAANAPYRPELNQLGLDLLCTNRDLPLSMPLESCKTHFTIDCGEALESVLCIGKPSRPLPSFAEGNVAWRLLNHLSLNYLSLTDTDQGKGAQALRELLALYSHPGDETSLQIDGVLSIVPERVTRRMPSPGPITFGRGVRLTLTMDDSKFAGTGSFLLGAVLDRFFAEYVSLNSFTETVVRTLARGEIMCWPARSGACTIL